MSRSIEIPSDFGFTEEHELLRQEARRFLEERCPIREVRRVVEDEADAAFLESLWKELGQLGWLGLVIPEEDGGAGLGQLHLALLLEEMGRCLLPAPYLGGVLAGLALEATATKAQRARWLPALASGELRASLALHEAGGFEPDAVRAAAEPTERGFVLRGEKRHALGAPNARLLVAPFREPSGDLGLYALELPAQGLTVDEERSVDRTRPTARLRFDGVRVGREARLGEPERSAEASLRRVLIRSVGAVAAEMVGGAESALELTRDYAIQRRQFDRQIGAFQAVKHPLVDMMVAIEFARTHAYAAAAAVDHETAGAEVAARMAKAQASDAFAFAVRKAVQIHGGYGFTWDCDVHLYFRRALWSRPWLGDALHHRRVLAGHLFA